MTFVWNVKALCTGSLELAVFHTCFTPPLSVLWIGVKGKP